MLHIGWKFYLYLLLFVSIKLEGWHISPIMETGVAKLSDWQRVRFYRFWEYIAFSLCSMVRCAGINPCLSFSGISINSHRKLFLSILPFKSVKRDCLRYWQKFTSPNETQLLLNVSFNFYVQVFFKICCHQPLTPVPPMIDDFCNSWTFLEARLNFMDFSDKYLIPVSWPDHAVAVFLLIKLKYTKVAHNVNTGDITL